MPRTLLTLLSVALVATLAAGCAPGRSSDNTFRGSAQAGILGRTALVCRVELPAHTPNREEKSAAILTLVAQAAASTPGLEPVDIREFQAFLGGRDPFGASDAELATAARKAGADSVALVLVSNYGGELVVSAVPPYWRTGLSFTYRARLVDAASATLYLDALRVRESSRVLGALGRADLDRAFAADMDALFRDTGPVATQGRQPS